MCQLEKPRANEITEPLAFTVCKLELRGKVIVLQSRSRRTRFNLQLWEKQNESDVLRQNKNKLEEQVLRGFKETHVLAVVNNGQNKREKTYFHKTRPNRQESATAHFQKCKEAFVSYNEESNNEE